MLLFNLLSDASNGGGGGYGTWIMLGLLVVIFGVMMWTSSRTNKKRAKEAQEKLDNMKVGDRVKTIGGICGIIVEINEAENTFVLETGKDNKGSFIKFDKIAVYETSPAEAVTENVETEEPKTEVFSDVTEAVEAVELPAAEEAVAEAVAEDENAEKTE